MNWQNGIAVEQQVPPLRAARSGRDGKSVEIGSLNRIDINTFVIPTRARSGSGRTCCSTAMPTDPHYHEPLAQCDARPQNGRMANTGVAKFDLIGFATIVNVEKAKAFYRDTLGLTLLMEEPPFALVFDANGTMIRLGMGKELPQAHGTVLGWKVPDIDAAVSDLVNRGVCFEKFEGMGQNEAGIWTSPTGARVAWFRDPDGNILSLSQHPELDS